MSEEHDDLLADLEQTFSKLKDIGRSYTKHFLSGAEVTEEEALDDIRRQRLQDGQETGDNEQ